MGPCDDQSAVAESVAQRCRPFRFDHTPDAIDFDRVSLEPDVPFFIPFCQIHSIVKPEPHWTEYR